MLDTGLVLSRSQIESRRPERNLVDARRPYGFFVEPECNALGEAVDVATILLTNRECPYRCVMCDLWKNTLTYSVAPGDIPHQIRYALQRLPQAREIKLYNSGSFFDRKAIPVIDYEAIAAIVQGYETVIVENHPCLCSDLCFRFQELVAPAKLEIAMGLETCHAETLRRLNKGMTVADFHRATKRLHAGGIRTRAFLLHWPPLMPAADASLWTMRSIDYAFSCGVNCCSVIATRGGNGVVDELQNSGQFTPPTGTSLEQIQQWGIEKRLGRVFVDLWEVERFFSCDRCRAERLARMSAMNLGQSVLPKVLCEHCQ